MNRYRPVPVLVLALCLLGSHPATPGQDAFAIVNVRIFNGTRMVPRGTVVVEAGRIAAAGPKVKPPKGAEVIDGSGATLLPGFIDAHTHAFDRAALERALVFGVTTELDMFTGPWWARIMREEQAATGAPDRADLFSAGFLATVPGGHGAQYGPVPTLTRPDEAQAWVDARIAEGSDYIKIVSEDGSAYAGERPTLDFATIAALIEAAHRRATRAVVHVTTQDRAKGAIEAGADGLVHIFVDGPPKLDFAPLAARKKAFVVPTLSVHESFTGVASGAGLVNDPRLAPYLTADEVANLQRAYSPAAGAPIRLEYAVEAVQRLRAAKVPILAGSDAPNPGTAHGVSLHREMEMLVEAGLKPIEALIAATSTPAKAFGLADRGRIAKGLRADLVLVRGNPGRDITATRDILRIWKAGHPVERPES